MITGFHVGEGAVRMSPLGSKPRKRLEPRAPSPRPQVGLSYMQNIEPGGERETKRGEGTLTPGKVIKPSLARRDWRKLRCRNGRGVERGAER